MLKPRQGRGYVISCESVAALTVGTSSDVAGPEGYSRASRGSR
jgi:hypothetical protein